METFTVFRGDVSDIPETSSSEDREVSKEDPIENKEIDAARLLAQMNKGLVGKLREVTKAEEKRNILCAPIDTGGEGAWKPTKTS